MRGRGAHLLAATAASALLALCAPALASAAPRAIITGGPEPTTTALDATITFAASDGVVAGRFECRFDGRAWVPCTSPFHVGGLSAGPHGVDVRLFGLFADTTPATRAWTILRDTVELPPPLAPVPGEGPASAQGCRHGASAPPAASRAQLERATLCLLNRARARRGLRAVRSSRTLGSVARRYAATMVRRKFFAHTTPDGVTFLERVRSSGYLRRRPWAVGEVLAWSRRGTPAGQVRALLRSRPHRRIILTPSYRVVGIGVARGTPRRGLRGGTVTVANFGRVG